ncbi:hypothetical protein GIB67_024201 [Kingdonia uniflora]|uniref:Uncharacterized protein n=1 Tax=Kingdonia uniflora TaxID=39325 RepID=A0A7J7LZF3_9MAGN|nr:hypothetical protein GIB67_024201 [Kingdonia uniflora]
MNNKAILSDSIVYLKGIIGETKKEEVKLAALATKVDELQQGNGSVKLCATNDQVTRRGCNISVISEVLIEDVPESGTEDRDYEAVIT